VNLNQVTVGAVDLFRHHFEKEGIELACVLCPEMPLLAGDAGQLTQVLVNLVVNAVQAMPSGGRLLVRTQVHEDHVICIVEDTGVGMTEEVRSRLFLPFFTTKEVNQGTGLGLPVVHGIVTAHGGTIEVTSAPGAGTTFTIRLPIEPTPYWEDRPES
jgi:two-component system, NtrC family, sensor kinase